MTSEQAIEVGKALLPYLRNDLRPEELGMAAHDAAAALNRTGGRVGLVNRAAKIERLRIADFVETVTDTNDRREIASRIRNLPDQFDESRP